MERQSQKLCFLNSMEIGAVLYFRDGGLYNKNSIFRRSLLSLKVLFFSRIIMSLGLLLKAVLLISFAGGEAP